MLSFPLVAEALTGLIYHGPSGENSSVLRCDLSIYRVVLSVINNEDHNVSVEEIVEDNS